MNFENICTPAEAEFILSNLKHTDNVLEYGSGQLALQIADKVKHVSVITHDLNQYAAIIENKPENLEIALIKTDIPQTSDDGTLDEFKSYINEGAALKQRFGKFNVIIIRGRARVECAKFAKEIAQDGCKIIVQDYAHPNPEYTRTEYFDIENHLTKGKSEFTVCVFSLDNDISDIQNPTEIKEVEFLTPVLDTETKKVSYKKVTTKTASKIIEQLPKADKKRVKSVAKEISKPTKKKK